VLIVLVLGALFVSLFRGTVISATSFFWRGDNILSRGLSNTIGTIRGNYSLASENRLMKERFEAVDRLEDSYDALLAMQEEVLDLFGRRDYGRGIAASVLMRPPETPYDLIIIDVGEDDLVTVGDRVLLPKAGIIGHVVESFNKQSKVLLYTSNGEETNAYLERGDVSIKLVGIGGGGFEFFVPRDIEVEEGDRVVTADIKAELLGTVVSVSLDTTDSEKRVLVSGVANISSLRFVEIE
jgi:cell shape-determining protein MreC